MEPTFPPLSRLFVVCGRTLDADGLETIFSAYGSVVSVRVAVDRSHKSRGFAFVQYEQATDAARAIEALHGQIVEDQLFKVSIAHASAAPRKATLTRKHASDDFDNHHGKRARDDKGASEQHAKRCMVPAPAPAVDVIVASVLNEMIDAIQAEAPALTKSIVKRKCFGQESTRFKQPKRATETPPARAKEPRKRKDDDEASLRAQLKRANLDADTPPPATKRPEKKRLAPKATTPPRSKLFVTSLVEYTHQELDALFRVYGDLEAVTLVPCQGKLRTMAYVKYAKATTALAALESLMEDPSLITVPVLIFKPFPSPTCRWPWPMILQRDQSSLSQTTTSCRRWLRLAPFQLTPECNWLLVEYATSLSNSTLSECMSACPGMLFMDIKVDAGTKVAKGVVFVKFASASLAAAAIDALAQHPSITSIERIPDPSGAYTQPDVDLRAVESQFAHLMSTQPYVPPMYAAPSPYSLYSLPMDPPPAAYPVYEYPPYPPPPLAPPAPPLPKPVKRVWLHITSSTPFAAGHIQACGHDKNRRQDALEPLEVLDVVVDGDEATEASAQFADANDALLAIHSLTQPGSPYRVKLTSGPSVARMTKKPKTHWVP
ncbi:hypothetical protein ACHHYP_10975 [Achlya hypogyna]|uniref:RRM domain-containing protein n=1 Tax=Achlya hypogyna TaxID=1202772 RepID=A0A1V9YK74_ACHHY|nr:hypothetical protein ACHHYP_10975 [Achlya hypogyna]